MVALSVLDLAPITQGSNAGQALRNAASLASKAEQFGYKRYWMAEHHSMPGIASAATAVALAYVGSQTSTIRIGSGGVMLPNHAPLVIAEQFGTLDALYPGRIDLGLGRAPGTDQAAAYAMRRNLSSDPQQFPADIAELMGYFRGDNGTVRAIPGERAQIPIYVLGSSLFGAQLAAMLGLPYAFASHFAPQMMLEAIRLYRDQFRPSEQLDRPYVMLGFNCFVAETDEQAALLSTSIQQAFVALRTGQPHNFSRQKQAMRIAFPSKLARYWRTFSTAQPSDRPRLPGAKRRSSSKALALTNSSVPRRSTTMGHGYVLTNYLRRPLI